LCECRNRHRQRRHHRKNRCRPAHRIELPSATASGQAVQLLSFWIR
jgi:hypothetical protein